MGGTKPRVFLSYRRADSAGTAGRINDRLVASLEDDHVFLDVADIPPGDDYLVDLERQLKRADYVLVIIGRQWLTPGAIEGKRRIDDPKDVVRWEIQTALANHVTVIPVLVDGAAMPQAAELPDDLRSFALCNAVEVTHTLFEECMTHLMIGVGAPVSRSKRHSLRVWLYLIFVPLGLTLLTRLAFSMSRTTATDSMDAGDTLFLFLAWLVVTIALRWLMSLIVARRPE